MSNLITHKLLHINNFNVLLFSYKQLLLIFNDIERLIEHHYKIGNIKKYHKMYYGLVLLNIKFKHCKNHIEYFKFKKIITLTHSPIF
jgi:hypothetical protein